MSAVGQREPGIHQLPDPPEPLRRPARIQHDGGGARLENRQEGGDQRRVVAEQQRDPPGLTAVALGDLRSEAIRGPVQLGIGRLPRGSRDRPLVWTMGRLLLEALRDRALGVQRYTTWGRV